ncbi:MAG: FCD domain-containing protein [Actinobacteria bacterium]|nr:FCD domain-containing protein [Actinomycetota bacterium]MCG2803709.1 FCD domain-containing protein [Cellulomonas sp.]
MRAETRHSAVVDVIAREIVAGVQPVGSRLSLAALQERFEISRTVAREAMRVLESKGMVESSRRTGLTVQATRVWNVLDPQVIAWRLSGAGRAAQTESLTQLRLAIEPFAAGLAAVRGDDEQRATLVSLARTMRTCDEQGDQAGRTDADLDFHALLLEASGNEMFQALSGAFRTNLGDEAGAGQRRGQDRAAYIDLHERIARAVDLRQPASAFQTMSRLLAPDRGDVTSTGTGQQPDPPAGAPATSRP